MRKEVKTAAWLKEAFEVVKGDMMVYALPSLIIIAIFMSIVGILIAGPLLCGFYHFIFERMNHLPSSVKDLFPPFEISLQAFLAGITTFSVFFIISLIPVFGWFLRFPLGALFIFVFPLIGEKRLSFIEAIKESFRLFQQNWIDLTLFYIIISIVGSSAFIIAYLLAPMLGDLWIIMAGLGVIITFPIYIYASACLYRDWVGFKENPSPPMQSFQKSNE